MDFSTTEAADDLGGLARTITESVCTPERQRELDGLDERFDRDLWAKLDRRRHPVHRGAGVIGRRRFRGARAGGGAGRAGPAAGRGALPGVGRARRGRAGEVRLRGAAAGVGGARRQRREDRRRRARRRHGRGSRCRPRPIGDGYRLDRRPATQVVLRTGGRRVPGARRNRFGHQGFRGRQGRRRRDGRPRWTPPATAVSAHLELQGVELGADRVVGGDDVVSPG